MKKILFLLALVPLLYLGCSTGPDCDALVPCDLIVPGISGNPKDVIPAIDGPIMISGDPAYVEDDHLVLGVIIDGEARAYPHSILDHHEIINDEINGQIFTVSYCPLTGTGIVFDRYVAGRSTTFGVSGLLYDHNLILYDRATESLWSQMRLDCIQGGLKGTPQKVLEVIETTWKTWKELNGNVTLVVSDKKSDIEGKCILEPCYRGPYTDNNYPYGNYRTSDILLGFPLTFDDPRLNRKDRIHGVIVTGKTKAYPFKAFIGKRVINDWVNSLPIVVLVDQPRNLIMSFSRVVGTDTLTFQDPGSNFPFTFKDEGTGSTWNLLTGTAVEGTMMGERLERTLSYNAYWFAWGAFWRGAEIYGQ
ncbi:DUF3179 domain-containing protein [candidate division TA06 bacterium]|nr:DUF3179 domain-containing protein [candidate division TA06 bacterium]